MAVYRGRTKQRFVLLVLILLSTTIVTLYQRGNASGLVDDVRERAHGLLAPVKSAVDAVLSPVADFFGGVAHYGELRAENAQLRQQLEEQRGAADRARNVEREYKELLELQGLPFLGDIPSVTTRVVSAAPTNFELTLEVDKGTSDGVAKGMPVVSGQGLVGRVEQASPTRATLLLVTDPESNVGVKLSGSGDVGVAHGRGSDTPLAVDFIDLNTAVTPGEVAVTSGLRGSWFPPGIPVGKVRSAERQPGAVQQAVALTPVADLRRVTFVKVLQWSPR